MKVGVNYKMYLFNKVVLIARYYCLGSIIIVVIINETQK